VLGDGLVLGDGALLIIKLGEDFGDIPALAKLLDTFGEISGDDFILLYKLEMYDDRACDVTVCILGDFVNL